jgi:hypothetical protein
MKAVNSNRTSISVAVSWSTSSTFFGQCSGPRRKSKNMYEASCSSPSSPGRFFLVCVKNNVQSRQECEVHLWSCREKNGNKVAIERRSQPFETCMWCPMHRRYRHCRRFRAHRPHTLPMSRTVIHHFLFGKKNHVQNMKL